MLDELRTGILHDVSDQIPGVTSDQLWTDKRLVRYINEAHRRFARRSLVIRDGSTPDCCQVQLVAGQTLYPLHTSVIGVISALYAGDNTDLARAGHAALGTYHLPDTFFFNPTGLSTLPPGKVLAFSTDEQITANDYGTFNRVTLRVYPAPATPYLGIVNLRVVRLPLERFSEDNQSAYPEVPEDYHLDLLDWAAYLALRIADNDAGDDDRALAYAKSFEDHCVAARKEVMRKLFTPAPWGFGQNGFSYSRDGEGY
jgi:hypothetical protein